VDQVVEEVSVRPSLAAEAAALGVPAGTAVLLIERVHLASGLPAEAGEIVIAADRFRLRYRIPVPVPAEPAPAEPVPPVVLAPPEAARLAPLPEAARLAPLPEAARLAPLPEAARLAPSAGAQP
jgi:hypothetical protein